jgi:hypothetical protein
MWLKLYGLREALSSRDFVGERKFDMLEENRHTGATLGESS